MPAIFSRPTPTSNAEKRKALVSHEDKSRLLRMGKRLRKGPFNAYVDPKQVGEGSAMLELSEAAKKAGEYNVWEEEVAETIEVRVRTEEAVGSPFQSDNISRHRHRRRVIPAHTSP